jgi:MOSC domain-containing protein YiiM
MMTQQNVVAIYVASKFGSLMSGHTAISVKAGKGIEGDRYFSDSARNRSSYKGQPDFEITLIESEVISRFNQDMGYSFHESDFRRNLITKGVRLNSLEGKNFTINGIELFGVRLCEPCASLQRRLGVSILPELMGKGGLRAQIKSNGIIRVGDRLDFS